MQAQIEFWPNQSLDDQITIYDDAEQQNERWLLLGSSSL